MATELGQAYIQIMPSSKGITGMIRKQIEPEASSAGSSAGLSLGHSMVKAVTGIIAAAGIGKFFAKTISEGAALQQSLGGIETLFKGSADRVKKYASQSFRTTGLSANEYMENVTSFSASLISSLGGNTKQAANLANTAMVDMSDNANKMGTDMDLITQTYQSLARGNYAMLDNLKLGYGGTKSEMERLMKDAEKLTGEHYTVGDFADTVKAIHAVQESLGITGTTAKEAATTLSGSFASMKASFSDVLGNLALGRDIEPSLNALAQTTSTFLFGNFIPMVGNILKGLPGAIVTFIQASIPQVQAGFKNLFSSIGVNIDFSSISSKFQGILDAVQPVISGLQTAFGQLPGLFNSIVTAVTPVVDAIVNGVSRMDFSGIQNLIVALVPAIQNAFSTLMSAVGPAIQGVVDSFVSLWNAAQPLISVIASGLQPILQVLASFLGGVLSGVLSGVKFAFDAIKIAIQILTPIVQAIVFVFQAFSPVISFLANLIGQLIGIFGSLGTAGTVMKDLVKGAWDAIKGGISVAGDVIKGIIEAIKGAFSAMGSAGSALKGIISSAWSGIKSAVSIAGSIINGVINGIKGAFSSLRNIDLSGAGSAIMNGFLGGLRGAWGAVKNFVSGIAGWIKAHKGPIGYDRKLLIPAGNAIMAGLNQGLSQSFGDVQKNIFGMNDFLASSFSSGYNVDVGMQNNLSSANANSMSDMLEYQRLMLKSIDSLADRPIQSTAIVDGSSFNKVNTVYQSAESAKRQKNAERGLALDVRF